MIDPLESPTPDDKYCTRGGLDQSCHPWQVVTDLDNKLYLRWGTVNNNNAVRDSVVASDANLWTQSGAIGWNGQPYSTTAKITMTGDGSGTYDPVIPSNRNAIAGTEVVKTTGDSLALDDNMLLGGMTQIPWTMPVPPATLSNAIASGQWSGTIADGIYTPVSADALSTDYSTTVSVGTRQYYIMLRCRGYYEDDGQGGSTRTPPATNPSTNTITQVYAFRAHAHPSLLDIVLVDLNKYGPGLASYLVSQPDQELIPIAAVQVRANYNMTGALIDSNVVVLAQYVRDNIVTPTRTEADHEIRRWPVITNIGGVAAVQSYRMTRLPRILRNYDTVAASTPTTNSCLTLEGANYPMSNPLVFRSMGSINSYTTDLQQLIVTNIITGTRQYSAWYLLDTATTAYHSQRVVANVGYRVRNQPTSTWASVSAPTSVNVTINGMTYNLQRGSDFKPIWQEYVTSIAVFISSTYNVTTYPPDWAPSASIAWITPLYRPTLRAYGNLTYIVQSIAVDDPGYEYRNKDHIYYNRTMPILLQQ